MKQKMINILNAMTQVEEGGLGLKSYHEVTDDTFELQTFYSQYGHKTWMKFEPTNDMELLRVETTHIFGYFDVSLEPNKAAGQLLSILGRNTGSFQGTSAFVGIRRIENTFYATLNGYHHFLMKWEDKEIAEALSLFLFDLQTGLITEEPALVILKMFTGS